MEGAGDASRGVAHKWTEAKGARPERQDRLKIRKYEQAEEQPFRPQSKAFNQLFRRSSRKKKWRKTGKRSYERRHRKFGLVLWSCAG